MFTPYHALIYSTLFTLCVENRDVFKWWRSYSYQEIAQFEHQTSAELHVFEWLTIWRRPVTFKNQESCHVTIRSSSCLEAPATRPRLILPPGANGGPSGEPARKAALLYASQVILHQYSWLTAADQWRTVDDQPAHLTTTLRSGVYIRGASSANAVLYFTPRSIDRS